MHVLKVTFTHMRKVPNFHALVQLLKIYQDVPTFLILNPLYTVPESCLRDEG